MNRFSVLSAKKKPGNKYWVSNQWGLYLPGDCFLFKYIITVKTAINN